MIEAIRRADEMYERRAVEMEKAKKDGFKVVGYACAYTPAEIIQASGAIPIRLMRGGEHEPCLLGEEYTTNIYCPFVKAFVGYRLEGKDPFYKMVDQIWMTHGCDMKRNIPEVWYRFFDTPTYVVCLPRTYYRESSLHFFLSDLKQGIKTLERLTQKKVTEEGLTETIEIYNEMRKLLRRIYRTRMQKNPPITGKDALRLSQYFFLLDPKEYKEVLIEIAEELEEMIRSGKGAFKGTPLRLMLSGSMIAYGDTKLLDLIEDEGRSVVIEDTCTGARHFYDLIQGNGDPLKAIAQRYLRRVPCSRMRPNTKRYEFIEEMVKDFQVDGVINYTLKFCFNYRTETYRLSEEMKKIGIPVLHLETDYSSADVGQLSTRLGAFFEMLEEGR